MLHPYLNYAHKRLCIIHLQFQLFLFAFTCLVIELFILDFLIESFYNYVFIEKDIKTNIVLVRKDNNIIFVFIKKDKNN